MVLLCCALLINLAYTLNFNPVSSSKPIFNIVNSATTAEFNKTGLPDTEWVIQDGYFGSTLTGIGVHSFTTTLMQPQLDFFRKMYPNMDKESLNMIFNRYAHIGLTDADVPSSPYPDQIKIPKQDIVSLTQQFTPIFSLPNTISTKDISAAGHIDSIDVTSKTITLRGWAFSPKHQLYINGFSDKELIDSTVIRREDVVNTMQDDKLLYSGFSMTFQNSINQPICIISYSPEYGYHKLIAPETDNTIYHCP